MAKKYLKVEFRLATDCYFCVRNLFFLNVDPPPPSLAQPRGEGMGFPLWTLLKNRGPP